MLRLVYYWLQRQSDTIRCVQHRLSKSRILLKVEAKLVNAYQTAAKYRVTLDGAICIAKQQRGAGGEVATLSVPRHNVETPTTGHYSKTHLAYI